MHHHHDMSSLLCGDHVFLGVRSEPGIPDDIVVRRVRPGVQQLRHRCHETIVARVFEGTSKCDGGIRFEDDLCYHFDTFHFIVSHIASLVYLGVAFCHRRKSLRRFLCLSDDVFNLFNIII
jgi:hypothetical protein